MGEANFRKLLHDVCRVNDMINLVVDCSEKPHALDSFAVVVVERRGSSLSALAISVGIGLKQRRQSAVRHGTFHR